MCLAIKIYRTRPVKRTINHVSRVRCKGSQMIKNKVCRFAGHPVWYNTPLTLCDLSLFSLPGQISECRNNKLSLHFLTIPVQDIQSRVFSFYLYFLIWYTMISYQNTWMIIFTNKNQNFVETLLFVSLDPFNTTCSLTCIIWSHCVEQRHSRKATSYWGR